MLESKKGKIAEIKFLGSVIQENTSLRGRIAILTYQDLSYSSIADRIIIFIEHLQSVTVFLISNYRFFTNKNSTSIDIITMVYAALAAFHPASYMIPSKKATKQILVLTLIAFLIFWFKMIIFGYIVMVAVKQKSPSKNLQVAWQWIFKLQTRVTYYFMAAIWTSLIEASFRDLLDVGEEINILLRVLGILMFVLEFGFSFLLKSQFTCILPNKSFASSKNNITPILTLLQKFVNQLIRRVLSFTPGTAIWVTSILVTMLSTVKLSCYFYYLPYYKIECLFYEMYFIVVVSALNVACLLQVIFGDGIIDINLMIGLWIILSALGLKVAVNYLKERLFKVVFENKKLHPEALVHKALTAKYFLKNRQSIQKQDWNNLVKLTLKENIVKAFPNQTFGIAAADLEEKETRNNIFSSYLEELLVKFPKNDFLRLYAAYHFAKKQRLFSKCLRAINELKNTNSWKVDASMSVLFQEIKHKIISDSQSKENIFDISEFALSTSSFAQAKLQIFKQMELQAGIYKEMKEPSPLLTKINKLGQEVIIMKRKIEASRKRLFQITPEYYVEPMLLYAYYELVLNHSYERFAHYHGIYNRRFQRYAKVFHSDDFCQENSFNRNTAFFIFSGEKKTQGKILHCGGNYEEIFGRNVSGYYLGITVPSIALTEHRILFSYIFENGDKMKLNKMKRRFYYHQDGYMTEIQYSFNISPYLSQGLAYYVVFQPVKSFRECILINKEGGIECFTKGIGEQLGLFALRNEEKNIGRICSELEDVNEAFNIVNNVVMTKPRKNKGESYAISREDEKVPGKSLFAIRGPMMNLEEAKEICSSFHEEGNKIIHLERVNNDTNNITFAYRCYINFLTNNKNGAKEIYLERVLENNPVSRNNTFGDAFNNDKNSTSSEAFKEEKIEWDECPETYENEKEAGWINFQTLEINCKMTSNPDMAPEMASSARHLLTSSRSIKQPHQTQINTQFQSLLTGGTEEGQKNKKKNQDTFSQGLLSRQESVFSLQSDFSNRNKMKNQRIFEKANLTFYKFPKYQFLTLVLYVVLVTIFILQQVLNYRVSEGFDELGSNKEIVLASESRNYYIVYLNTIICWIYGQATGLFEISAMIPGSNLATFQVYVGWGVANLTDTNSELFGVTNSLNDVQRERLFQKDVRLFEVNGSESTNFTSFEATNRMIETALRVESTMMDDLSATIMDMLFLGQNMMDDLLTKGSTIADEFLADLQDRKDGFVDSLTYTFLGITIVPIGGLIVGYCFIFAQYRIDLRNMFAFTKINKNAVENALVNLTQFQLFIQQNVNFENIHDDENCMNLLKSNNNSLRSSTKLLDNSQSPNSKGFTKVYFVFALKVFFMLTLVTVTFVAYYIVFTDNLKSLGDKAYKLYYLDRVASRILLLRSGAFELALTNDTATINNAKVSVTLKEQILGLQSIQHQLQDFFDSGEDDMIQNIMFNDACEYLEDQVSAYNFCKVLGNYQNKASWINLISNIKGLFQEYLTSYELSDKTSDSLSALGRTYVANIMRPIAGVTTAVNALLTDKINTEFTEINDQSKRLTSIMPAIYVVVILVTLYIGLYEVIYPLNFKENRFRQLLLLFPANVVLSNFMLKSYLLKVSKGAFDSIHNDI